MRRSSWLRPPPSYLGPAWNEGSGVPGLGAGAASEAVEVAAVEVAAFEAEAGVAEEATVGEAGAVWSDGVASTFRLTSANVADVAPSGDAAAIVLQQGGQHGVQQPGRRQREWTKEMRRRTSR